MKRIRLRSGQKHNSREVFRAITENSPQKPLGVADIRKRVKLLDAIDKATGDSLILEDADHATLKAAMEEFPWQQANPQLLQVIDDVLEARDVSTAQLQAVETDEGLVAESA